VIARTHKDEVLCFVDNDKTKWNQEMEGFPVLSAKEAETEFPDALWTASVIRPERKEIIEQMEGMGVRTVPVWGYLPKRHTMPPGEASNTIFPLLEDLESRNEWLDQLSFRKTPDYSKQRPSSDINEIYFTDFIKHLDDEHFVDCGAADGDTVTDFLKRWPKYRYISAFEPDPENARKLSKVLDTNSNAAILPFAVGDVEEVRKFTSTGDYSARLDDQGETIVECVSLDRLFYGPHSTEAGMIDIPPTFIKMDIEGSEPEALWGARRILKEHKPVLAICAYHEAEHLWELPLLIHALQPEYKLFLRRYAEGTFELVWYAVPKERVVGS